MGADSNADDVVHRFEASMVMDFEKWHDGIGYDMDAIAAATPAELTAITKIVLRHGVDDWRDVEALAAIGTEAATSALTEALEEGSLEVRLAVLRQAPDMAHERQRTAVLVDAVQHADIGGGLTPMLAEIEDFHPPAIVDALLRGCLDRAGEVAVHLAAMVAFVHGATKEPFDWAQRPLFLRFNTPDGKERRAALVDLCTLVGVDPAPYVRPER